MPEVSPEVITIITRKKLWYCRYTDTKQWHLFDGVAVPECKFQYFSDGKLFVNAGFTYSWGSREEFTTFFTTALASLRTMHLIGPGEFEQVSEDEVKAIFPITYFSALKQTESESHGVQGQGGGYYFETYKKIGDDWLMTDLKMERTYEK
ncbi:bile acid 7-alpha [Trichoderma cornu-damae]|uniref:Bile acid 7-alpha n=1 Tax=Trichoderma cornu-damae TaxID=654480 RepID=A0A9P8QW00_9HYPO|nr:bile acid 7-alpha [Trichoderma cornu-damae]